MSIEGYFKSSSLHLASSPCLEEKRAGTQTEQMAAQGVLTAAEISEYYPFQTKSLSLASLSIEDRRPCGQVFG